MTNDRAIHLLESMAVDYPQKRYQEAINVAIEALSEPKTGEWILTPMLSDNYRYECSNCMSHHRARYDYCPSCGRRMFREEDENETY